MVEPHRLVTWGPRWYLLGVGFRVSSPPELVDHLRALAARYAAATV
jgi:hypothetical protein